MPRSLKFTDASGNTLSLTEPTGLSGDVALELPDADGSAGHVLVTDGAGKLSFSAAATMGGSGTAGRVPRFSAGTTLANSTLRDDGSNAAVGGAVSASYALKIHGAQEIAQSGAAVGLHLDQSGAASAIDLDQSGAGTAIDLDYSAGGSDDVVTLDDDSTGVSLHLTKTGNGKALRVNKTAVGAGDVCEIVNEGTGRALRLDQNGDAVAMNIDVDAASTSDALEISNAGSGEGISLTQSGNGTACDINKTAIGSGDGLNVNNAGTGRCGVFVQTGDATAVLIDQDGEGFALAIQHAAASEDAVQIDDGSTGDSIEINKTANGTVLDLNKTASGAGAVVDINNDGTGLAITISQAQGDAVLISHANATGTATYGLDVASSGAGNSCSARFRTTASGPDHAVLIDGAGTGPAVKLEHAGSGNLISTDQGFALRGDGAVVFPSFTDANRGAAGVAGRVIFNTDDGNLNVDTGGGWILPDGTAT